MALISEPPGSHSKPDDPVPSGQKIYMFNEISSDLCPLNFVDHWCGKSTPTSSGKLWKISNISKSKCTSMKLPLSFSKDHNKTVMFHLCPLPLSLTLPYYFEHIPVIISFHLFTAFLTTDMGFFS
jgi:hypothetical protein